MPLSPQTACSIGVDFGTNSARALIVDVADGREVAAHVVDYPSGERGILLDPSEPDLARQHPGDYVLGFEQSIRGAVEAALGVDGFAVDRVVGIGIDTTGSTPIPVDRDGTPLALKDEFRDHPAAQAWLWKDHTAHAEAAEITALAVERDEPYLAKCGGVYSSEWFWAKILRCCRTSPEVFDAAYSWVELADWVPAYACGTTAPDRLVRGICAAGHKAMFHPDWGGLPSEAFLNALAPALGALRDRLYDTASPSSERAGELSADVAERCGLRPGIPVAVGAFDAHHGAVGAGVGPGTLVKIMGTSTCDITTCPVDDSPALPDIPGLCGIVPGSVAPDEYGFEAGQSAVGDLFNWVASHLTPESYAQGGESLIAEAERLRPGATGLLALDWNNGNRTVLVNPRLSGLLIGQTLHTTAAEVFRAVVEATAFGALKIINRLEAYGVNTERVINCGITHTHSPKATAFAQARQAIPCLGTTHADHFATAVPVTRPLTADEMNDAYEANTSRVIVERFEGDASLDAQTTPGVLVAGHAPFAWGHAPSDSVDNAAALEACAAMALDTFGLCGGLAEVPELGPYVHDKHHRRKHGPAAYYGQVSD